MRLNLELFEMQINMYIPHLNFHNKQFFAISILAVFGEKAIPIRNLGNVSSLIWCKSNLTDNNPEWTIMNTNEPKETKMNKNKQKWIKKNINFSCIGSNNKKQDVWTKRGNFGVS